MELLLCHEFQILSTQGVTVCQIEHLKVLSNVLYQLLVDLFHGLQHEYNKVKLADHAVGRAAHGLQIMQRQLVLPELLVVRPSSLLDDKVGHGAEKVAHGSDRQRDEKDGKEFHGFALRDHVAVSDRVGRVALV